MFGVQKLSYTKINRIMPRQCTDRRICHLHAYIHDHVHEEALKH